MRLKPWMIWTVVVSCLLSTLVGVTLMLFADLRHSETDGLMKTGVLMAALPMLFLLASAQQCHVGVGGGGNVRLASRTVRLLIWSIVVMLVFGTVFLLWALGLERQ